MQDTEKTEEIFPFTLFIDIILLLLFVLCIHIHVFMATSV